MKQVIPVPTFPETAGVPATFAAIWKYDGQEWSAYAPYAGLGDDVFGGSKPTRQIRAIAFLPYGYPSFTRPPGPFYSAYEGRPQAEYPCGGGPGSYPDGLKFYRKHTRNFSFHDSNADPATVSATETRELLWNKDNDFKFTEEINTTGDASLGAWTGHVGAVISGKHSQIQAANPSWNSAQVQKAVREWVQANSSYSEDGYTMSLSVTSTDTGITRGFTDTVTLEDEDTWEDLLARLNDFAANAPEAQWEKSQSDDFTNSIGESWRSDGGNNAAIFNSVVQDHYTFLRASNPAVISQRRGQRFAFVVRVHHRLPDFYGETNGVWTHTHSVSTYAGKPAQARSVPNIAHGNEVAEGVYGYLQPVASETATLIRREVLEDEIPWGGAMDAHGYPNNPDDAGWAARPWIRSTTLFTPRWGQASGRNWVPELDVAHTDWDSGWDTLPMLAALRLRVVAKDGRAGWQVKIRNYREEEETYDFTEEVVITLTTTSGGASVPHHIPSTPFENYEFIPKWQGGGQVIELKNPEGDTVPLAQFQSFVNLEAQARFGGSFYDSPFRGPTGKLFKTRKLRMEYSATSTPTAGFKSFALDATSCARVSEIVQTYQPVIGITPNPEGRTAASVTASINGVAVDVADVLLFEDPAWDVVGFLGTTITESPTGRVTTTSYASSNATPKSVIFRHEIAFNGANDKDSILPVDLAGWGVGRYLRRAIPCPAPLSSVTHTDAMSWESRAPAWPATAYRTPHRQYSITDPSEIVCISDGWAKWESS